MPHKRSPEGRQRQKKKRWAARQAKAIPGLPKMKQMDGKPLRPYDPHDRTGPPAPPRDEVFLMPPVEPERGEERCSTSAAQKLSNADAGSAQPDAG